MVADRKSSVKLTVVVAGLSLLAASGLVWSKSRATAPDAATASAISPMDLMFKHGGRLPTETWDSF